MYEKWAFFWWPFLRAEVFTTGFIVNPVVNSLKSRCKNWPFQNAETSVAAEPFEWARNAKIWATTLKIIKISSKISAKTLKHRWLPSQMHRVNLHKSLKNCCKANVLFSVPFLANCSENAETSVAVDPNASWRRRRFSVLVRFGWKRGLEDSVAESYFVIGF